MRNCSPTWLKCGVIFDVDKKSAELAKLEDQAAAPGFWDDQNAARSIIDATNNLRVVVKPFLSLQSSVDDIGLMLELAEEETDERQLSMAMNDIESALERADKDFAKMELQSLLSGQMDSNNAIVTLHAGAGGTESCDWADMLYRMYRRYCETHDFDVEVMDFSAGEEAGIKSVTFIASGPFAYGNLKNERGVHRLVRISPFDSNKRRHTSFSALDVVPEIDDDIEVEIKKEDVREDTFRSSGSGGQHVNTTDSAVRLTHIPTGIVVACQAERSQHKNRAKAQKILKAKLYEYEQDLKRKDMEKFYGKKGEIAWGSQIRSYVMQPYTMVKDHRTGCETSNVNAVMDGDLDDFIEAQLKNAKAQEQG
jgi:peptide chain release factor 2